jgi:hypothetical protein
MGSGSTILLNAAAMNKAKCTVSDYQAAEKARATQRRIGRPSTQRYTELISKGRIRNCAITRQDIINAKDIFGPDLGSLKGKTVRKASDQVRSGGLVPIPATIMAHCRKIVLCVDVMKVNKMPFLMSISRAIKFGTVAWLKNAKAETILRHIRNTATFTYRADSFSKLLRSMGNSNHFAATSQRWESPSTNALAKNMFLWLNDAFGL